MRHGCDKIHLQSGQHPRPLAADQDDGYASCHHDFQRTLTMSKQKPPITVTARRLERCQSDKPAAEAGIVSVTTVFALIARWGPEWRHHVPALRRHTAWWPEN